LYPNRTNNLDLLDHVEDGFVLVEPDVVVGHCHLLEGDLFGIFEERVGPPHELEPTDRQQPVLGSHVVWQPQPIVFPALSKENVSGKRLKKIKRN
jgi:hypothetical protein